MSCESLEQRQLTITPPASVVGSVNAQLARTPTATPSGTYGPVYAQPIQNPMQNVITLEHGVDLRSKCTIHEGHLCAHSQHMQQLSTKAETLREKYNNCDDLFERLESITMVGLTPEQYEGQKVGAKLLPLIVTIEDKYPLQEYQKAISKLIISTVDQQFANKNIKQSEKTPKSKKDFLNLGLRTRLSLLNSEGALEVAEEVYAKLQRIKATERQNAKTIVIKAWAQGRLLLRGASEKSVLSFVEWAYHSTLRYEDAEHLYSLWRLAKRLHVDALAHECMDRLYDSASSSICNALSNDVPLRYLLGFGSSEEKYAAAAVKDDIVATVFSHVLNDTDPPASLSQLVVNAMAQSMDSELWAELKDMVNHDVARQLIEVMMIQRDIKPEQGLDSDADVKLENQHAADAALTTTNEAHHGSTHLG